MRMRKERVEQLLEEVEERLKETRQRLLHYKEEVELLTCAKAYLEFILHGLESNPSKKRGKNA